MRRSRGRTCALIAALTMTALAGGCGSGLHPVEGKVTWKDGTPAKELAGSHVVFDLPERQISARGLIQADGTFRLTTHKPDDGVPAGDYKVLIIEVGRKTLGDGVTLAPGAIPSRYADPTTSDLRATVPPGGGPVTLSVERPPRR